ncbi:GATA transcription factor 15 [Typha angustifolia]|uniref:GATA transcription factor 15 n=1 Tax=Typha angustifolia TaxID=59011 RepID=UPI003C2EB12F
MDLAAEKTSGSIDLPSSEECSEEPKCCAICQTTKTPLWRGGPSGPKSLCNACGIRYRKKRREVFGMEEGEEDRKKEKREELGVPLKLRMLGLGKELWLNQRSVIQKRRRSRMGEEEQAAVLLMALSSGLLHG